MVILFDIVNRKNLSVEFRLKLYVKTSIQTSRKTKARGLQVLSKGPSTLRRRNFETQQSLHFLFSRPEENSVAIREITKIIVFEKSCFQFF